MLARHPVAKARSVLSATVSSWLVIVSVEQTPLIALLEVIFLRFFIFNPVAQNSEFLVERWLDKCLLLSFDDRSGKRLAGAVLQANCFYLVQFSHIRTYWVVFDAFCAVYLRNPSVCVDLDERQ